MPTLVLVLWAIVGLVAVIASIIELRGATVPKWLPIAALVVVLALRTAVEGFGSTETGLVTGLLGAAGCAVPFSVFAFAGKRAGWGDVSLMAAVGAGLGIPRALTALMLISLVGAAAALIAVARRRSTRHRDSTNGPRVGVDSGRSIPYCVPIAVGTMWAMVWAGPSVSDEGLVDDEVVVSADGGTTVNDEAGGELDHVE